MSVQRRPDARGSSFWDKSMSWQIAQPSAPDGSNGMVWWLLPVHVRLQCRLRVLLSSGRGQHTTYDLDSALKPFAGFANVATLTNETNP
jgi:hypothetical protein